MFASNNTRSVYLYFSKLRSNFYATNFYATIFCATFNTSLLLCLRDFRFNLDPGSNRKAEADRRRIFQLGQLRRGETLTGRQLRDHRDRKSRLGSADLPQRSLALSHPQWKSDANDRIRP